MVKITLLAASIAAIAASVMAQAENATPTPAPTAIVKRDEIDNIVSSYYNYPEEILKHLSMVSERMNQLPSEARIPAQSRIAEKSRSVAALMTAATPTPTGIEINADQAPNVGNQVNMGSGAVAAAIVAAVAAGALM